jgi:RNA polymerase sigma-70 factor (ECF subfamily)
MSEPDRRKREEFAREALPHMDQVYTAGLYLTRNQDEAEELLQETFLRAYRFWHQFTSGTNCRAWLMTILHNTFKNRYRERYRERQRVDFDDGISETNNSVNTEALPANPEDIVLAQFLDTEVEEALKSLPVEFLEVIVLVDIQELTYEEAAAAIGCPIGTIRSRLSRGRRLLHGALQQYAKERGYGRGGSYALR